MDTKIAFLDVLGTGKNRRFPDKKLLPRIVVFRFASLVFPLWNPRDGVRFDDICLNIVSLWRSRTAGSRRWNHDNE